MRHLRLSHGRGGRAGVQRREPRRRRVQPPRRGAARATLARRRLENVGGVGRRVKRRVLRFVFFVVLRLQETLETLADARVDFRRSTSSNVVGGARVTRARPVLADEILPGAAFFHRPRRPGGRLRRFLIRLGRVHEADGGGADVPPGRASGGLRARARARAAPGGAQGPAADAARVGHLRRGARGRPGRTMRLLTRRVVRGAFAVAALARAAPAQRRAGGSGHHDRRSSTRARAIGGSARGRGRERRPGRPRRGRRRGHPDASKGEDTVPAGRKSAGGGSRRRGSAGRVRRPTAPRDAGRLARSQSLSTGRSRRPWVRSRRARACASVSVTQAARTKLPSTELGQPRQPRKRGIFHVERQRAP